MRLKIISKYSFGIVVFKYHDIENSCHDDVTIPVRITYYIKSVIYEFMLSLALTHWGRVTHICIGNLTIIGSDNGLAPGRRQAIIRTNAGILLIIPLATNFSEFFVRILIFSFKKMHLKVSSAKQRPFCLRLNESKHSFYGLQTCIIDVHYMYPTAVW